MKTNNNMRKIWAAAFVVTLFLISSMVPVINAEMQQDVQQRAICSGHSQSFQTKEYAVIMVGRYFGLWTRSYLLNMSAFLNTVQQYYTWYLNAASMAYTTLRDTYGYDEDNIFLLVKLLPDNIYFNGKQYFTIPEVFDSAWVDYTSSEENLENVLNTFKPGGENELTENDQLFFCFIDHGANEKVNYYANDHWVSEFIPPESHFNTDWTAEYKAYDTYVENVHYIYHNTDTGAVYNKAQNGWSDKLILSLNEPKTIKGFRISANKQKYLDQMDISFYKDDSLVKNVTLNDWPDGKYKYVEFEGEEKVVDEVKISFHENDPKWGFAVRNAVVYDFNFWEIDGCGEVGRTYFGCPFLSIPEFLMFIFGNDVEKLYDDELMSYINGINAKIIYALQPCVSGGFISELSGENRIVCTASRGFELADASWIEPFIRALNKTYPEADLDNNGKISILEAYRYAAGNVEKQLSQHPNFPPQHPLIDDNGDYIGHHFYETNYYDPIDPNKDGYLAAHTFL